MCSKAASALAKANNLKWSGEENSLIAHKDYLMYTSIKVFIKEKEL